MAVGARTELFVRQQSGGVYVAHNLGDHPSDIFFVDSAVGSDSVGYGRNPDAPFATLDYAFSQCTASKGNVIYVMPGHAETTTLIGFDVAGVKVIGLGFGRNRPTFTATTAASDLASVSAANIEVENIRLVGAASGCTALMDITAADFVARRVSFEQAATPLEGVTISADRFLFENCTWLGTADGPDRCISLEAKCNDWRIDNCRFLFGKNGLDNEIIKSAQKSQIGYLIREIYAVGLDTLIVNMASSSAAAPDGLLDSGTFMYSAAVTSIEDGIATSKGMAFGPRVYAVDVTNKAAGKIPLTTAS